MSPRRNRAGGSGGGRKAKRGGGPGGPGRRGPQRTHNQKPHGPGIVKPGENNRPAKKKRQGTGAWQKLKATFDKNRKGFGFLIFQDRRYEDSFVPPREADALFHGDRVEVSMAPDGTVTHIKVLEHRFRELVGRFTPTGTRSGSGGWVVYERKSAREEVFSPQGAPKAKSGDWVRAKLQFHDRGPFKVTAEIVEVYGTDLPATADVGMIAAEYNLVEEHTQTAEREARQFRLEIPGKDSQGREDLRKVPFITIDGETARDFDDAVFVETNPTGSLLWVAIADVSHYVTKGSALDAEAYSRGTSVYFPERAFHMLPGALSENLCSLKPNEPRLALVAKMQFGKNGDRLKTEIVQGIIQSQRRATYNEIEKEWNENRTNPKWEFAPHFALFQLLKKRRTDRGSIDFDLPEAEVKVGPDCEPISITNRARLDAHRLIEEFMISANEAVTVWIMERHWPFVFRVHAEPKEEAMEKFQSLVAAAGIKFNVTDGVSPKILSDLVRRFEGHPAQDLLNMALLRSMKQAVYSSTHGIHYGLASQAYTHFTSPIRRYPDLVVHRLLRHALLVEKGRERPLRKNDREELEKLLEEICEHCSYRERLAADADREAIKLKQVRAIKKRLGDEFDGKVIGMAEAGLFVTVNDPYVEGLISRDSLTDDFYEFNEERMIYAGRRKKRTFKIGDKLRVLAVRADLDRRQIDFGLVAQIGK